MILCSMPTNCSPFVSPSVDVDKLECFTFHICEISVEASYPAKSVLKRIRSKAYAQLVSFDMQPFQLVSPPYCKSLGNGQFTLVFTVL